MSQKSLEIVYDGECPFCSRYVRFYRLREAGIKVTLTDARQHPEKNTALLKQGMDLDVGMVVEFDQVRYHGAQAVHLLALLSSPSGLFNRLNGFIFSRSWLARLLYPFMVAGRNLTLLAMGKHKLNAPHDH